MNTTLKKILAVAALGTTCFTVKPIHETTAKVGAVVGGVGVGALSGVGTYYGLDDGGAGGLNKNARLAIAGIVGMGAGALTWYLLDMFLHSLTPTGRVSTARLLIDTVEHDSLVNKKFSGEKELFSFITAHFGTSWPLVLGREHYMKLTTSLEAARQLLMVAYDEARGKSEYSGLIRQCEKLRQKIVDLAATIEPRVTTIANHEKYHFQVRLFEKHMEAERQRSHEKAMQAANLGHDSVERERDRREKQNILAQNPLRPTILNI